MPPLKASERRKVEDTLYAPNRVCIYGHSFETFDPDASSHRHPVLVPLRLWPIGPRKIYSGRWGHVPQNQSLTTLAFTTFVPKKYTFNPVWRHMNRQVHPCALCGDKDGTFTPLIPQFVLLHQFGYQEVVRDLYKGEVLNPSVIEWGNPSLDMYFDPDVQEINDRFFLSGTWWEMFLKVFFRIHPAIKAKKEKLDALSPLLRCRRCIIAEFLGLKEELIFEQTDNSVFAFVIENGHKSEILEMPLPPECTESPIDALRAAGEGCINRRNAPIRDISRKVGRRRASHEDHRKTWKESIPFPSVLFSLTAWMVLSAVLIAKIILDVIFLSKAIYRTIHYTYTLITSEDRHHDLFKESSEIYASAEPIQQKKENIIELLSKYEETDPFLINGFTWYISGNNPVCLPYEPKYANSDCSSELMKCDIPVREYCNNINDMNVCDTSPFCAAQLIEAPRGYKILYPDESVNEHFIYALANPDYPNQSKMITTFGTSPILDWDSYDGPTTEAEAEAKGLYWWRDTWGMWQVNPARQSALNASLGPLGNSPCTEPWIVRHEEDKACTWLQADWNMGVGWGGAQILV